MPEAHAAGGPLWSPAMRPTHNKSHMCVKKCDNRRMDFGDPVEALIPGVQGRVLTVLARTEAELTMRAVAELAGVSANQATVVLNRLVHLGLVERRDVGSAGLVRLIRDNEAARAVLTRQISNAGCWRGWRGRRGRSGRPRRVSWCSVPSPVVMHTRTATSTCSPYRIPKHRLMTDGGRQRSASGPIGRPGSPAIRSICSKPPWTSCRSWSVASENRGGRLWMRESY